MSAYLNPGSYQGPRDKEFSLEASRFYEGSESRESDLRVNARNEFHAIQLAERAGYFVVRARRVS